jgi:CDP-diacylglycerol--glycerol-3-phosphate 3-phosphatidyltransferase
MLERFRAAWTKVIAPIAAFFVRHNVSPDVITVAGTLGVVVGAAVCYPQGWLWQGTLIIFFFVFADMVDGQMARSTGRSSKWGAFLDSSLDRLGDGAVFGGIALYFVYGAGHQGRDVAFGWNTIWTAVTLWALVMGQVTSYVKARAESLGFQAGGGLAARADRLLIILLGAWLCGLTVPYALEIAVTALAVMSTMTVFQRIFKVRSQARDQEPPIDQDVRGAGA